MQTKIGIVAVLVLATTLTGCFGSGAPPPPPVVERPPELDETEFGRLEQLAAAEVRNYSLPGSNLLEPVVKWFNGTIDPSANAAYQDRNMRGGNDFNTQLITFSVADLLPDGQPTALRLTLSYFGKPGSSAKADLYACVPGHCSYYTTSNNDEFNWKATVETVTIMTVGSSGAPTDVGVAVANGKMASPLEFSIQVVATYFQDVLTPHNAYAFLVPEGATGVTLRSVKPGQEHLQAKFVVLDPQDELVAYTEYDDIAVVSESIFIPTRQPGEYVFYAQEMHGGFFSITSDAPLGNDTALRPLMVQETRAALTQGPAPGMVERDILGAGAPTPWSKGTDVAFSVDTGFPLEVGAYIGEGVTGAAEVRLLSSKGEVYRLQRVARVDAAQGSLGYTRDETNTMTNWANLAKGAYAAEVVSNAVTGEFGYFVKTYQR